MMGTTPSGVVDVRKTGHITVSIAANEAIQASFNEFLPFEPSAIPLDGRSALANRRTVVINVPIDRVYLGADSEFGQTAAYRIPGSGRGANLASAPNIQRYSNRKQFLRASYETLRIGQAPSLYVRSIGSAEAVGAIELA